MGRLKDALYVEVWRHLQALPQCRTLLTSLNSPAGGLHSVRGAWSELQANGSAEGVRKKTGLQAVLKERNDLFVFTTTGRGHLLIGLTEGAQSLSPDDGVPPNVLTADGNIAEDLAFSTEGCTMPLALDDQSSSAIEAWGAGAGSPTAFSDEALRSHMEAIRAETAWDPAELTNVLAAAVAAASATGDFAEAEAEPQERASKYQRVSLEQGWCKGRGKGKNSSGYYQDWIWTPALEAQRKEDIRKEVEFARALVNAMEMHGGQGVSLSQLGSDFNVARLKKEPQYKNVRLLDLLRSYDELFELLPDGVTGGWIVKLQPNAHKALPSVDGHIDGTSSSSAAPAAQEAQLPDRMDNPGSVKDKMQALRIELLYALHRRGSRVPLQELGQEPRVQQRKAGLHQAKKLVEFVRLFPRNFSIVTEDSQMIVETASLDVGDQSMIDQSINRNHQAMQHVHATGKFKGKGRSTSRSSSGVHAPAGDAAADQLAWLGDTCGVDTHAIVGALMQITQYGNMGYGSLDYAQPP